MLSQTLTQKNNEQLIIEDYPPHYKRWKAKFPNLEESKPLFAWDNHIYNPFKVKVLPDLFVHERKHFEQQGDNPEVWLDKYLTDDNFRLEQEVQAYGSQFAYCKKMLPAKWYKIVLEACAKSLSGSLYNGIISYHQAETLIRNYDGKHI
jgi:hypothetical protein